MTASLLKSALFSALLTLAGCSCGDNDAAARSARSMSQEQLAAIHGSLASLHGAGRTRNLGGTQLPPELKMLAAGSVHFRGGDAWVHMSGCGDDKVYLFVNGLEPTSARKEIVLSPGELGRQEVLWQFRR